MSGYSTDLRERVVVLREKGETQGRIAEVLGLNISTVKRYLVRYQHRSHVAATVQGRMQPRLGEAEEGVFAYYGFNYLSFVQTGKRKG